MFNELKQYLFQYKELRLPEIGSFSLEQSSARSDFSSRSIQAPEWNILFHQNDSTVNDAFYIWLSNRLNISKEEAKQQFLTFISSILSQMEASHQVDWEGIGSLKKEGDIGVIFIPLETSLSPFTEVVAQKVIRHNANHNIIVGETETTTQAMMEQMGRPDQRKHRIGIIAWIILILSMALAAWHFISNGFNLKAMGNKQKTQIIQPSDTYKLK